MGKAIGIELEDLVKRVGRSGGLALMFAAGCADRGHGDEVLRRASPGAGHDAVVIESSQGATTSYSYRIYLVRRQEKVEGKEFVAELYGAVRNDSAYGVNLRWRSDSALDIEYLSAKSEKLLLPLAANGRVQVTLKSGVLDKDAPAGGMAYSQRLRP